MTINTGGTKEDNERIAQFRKRHTISSCFNGAQLKVLSDACSQSKCTKSSLVRQAVMEYLCIKHGSFIPPGLDYLDEGNTKKVPLSFRRLRNFSWKEIFHEYSNSGL